MPWIAGIKDGIVGAFVAGGPESARSISRQESRHFTTYRSLFALDERDAVHRGSVEGRLLESLPEAIAAGTGRT